MSESNAIQTIKDPNDPLNLKIIYGKEFFGFEIIYEIIHDKEKNQLNARLLYDNEEFFFEYFFNEECTKKIDELSEKRDLDSVSPHLGIKLLFYYESNFDAIAIIRGWKKKKK